jgi:hypothetical protein
MLKIGKRLKVKGSKFRVPAFASKASVFAIRGFDVTGRRGNQDSGLANFRVWPALVRLLG